MRTKILCLAALLLLAPSSAWAGDDEFETWDEEVEDDEKKEGEESEDDSLFALRSYRDSISLTLPAGIGGMIGATAAVIPGAILTVMGGISGDPAFLIPGTFLGAAVAIPMLAMGITGLHTTRMLADADDPDFDVTLGWKLRRKRWVDGYMLFNVGLAAALGGGMTPLLWIMAGLENPNSLDASLAIALFSLPAAGVAVAIGVPLAVAGGVMKRPIDDEADYDPYYAVAVPFTDGRHLGLAVVGAF